MQAKDLIGTGQITKAKRLQRQLKDYPLYPYLDLYLFERNLQRRSAKDLVSFATAHQDIPVVKIIQGRWLRAKGRARDWASIRQNPFTTSSAELECYLLRAEYALGDRQKALDDTTERWLSPTSQPKSCDPLFDVWRATERFNEDVAWLRLHYAIQARERVLARYLLRFFSGANKSAADAYYQLYQRPEAIKQISRYAKPGAKYRQMIRYGISRLGQRDGQAAAKAWASYQKTNDFSAATVMAVTQDLMIADAREGRFPEFQDAQDAQDAIVSYPEYVVEELLDAAIQNQKWSEVSRWSQQLTPEERQKIDVQYWRARALEATSASADQAQQVYTAIASKRHYYGFLAAKRLDIKPTIVTRPLTILSQADEEQLRQQANVARALELFAIGDDLNARREWFAAAKVLSNEQHRHLAKLAARIGQPLLAIQTANSAGARDDLGTRFPMDHHSSFTEAAHKNDLAHSLVRAIARQESAFNATARSSAGALGLMQMIPATAALAAKRSGLKRPTETDLLLPARNIELASFHLAWLIERFDQQRPLAIAAYNAGEHRVDRWIADQAGADIDAWIERIPFRETRDYVKNVLAFNVVYAHLLGRDVDILEDDELTLRPRS